MTDGHKSKFRPGTTTCNPSCAVSGTWTGANFTNAFYIAMKKLFHCNSIPRYEIAKIFTRAAKFRDDHVIRIWTEIIDPTWSLFSLIWTRAKRNSRFKLRCNPLLKSLIQKWLIYGLSPTGTRPSASTKQRWTYFKIWEFIVYFDICCCWCWCCYSKWRDLAAAVWWRVES